jgi:asparagine synthase (glutamine-hydrolysing)
MCGFLAILDPNGFSGREEPFRRALDRMSHRGPDGSGTHFDGPVALGHRRLSIIDLEGGRQPMSRRSGELSVVFNGEIYNFAEIRDELAAKGHRFETHSDTEVILAAYEEWGPDCVRKFIGMFAFALWDAPKRRFWVVRDRLGIKPLYWVQKGGVFACASEIGPLIEFGLVQPEMNERALDSFFTLGYVPAPETMFAGVRKLEPGWFLIVENGTLSHTEYWDFAGIEPEPLTEKEARDRIAPLLEDAVRRCLVSDVPLGAFLSGGLDSSLVVALMDRCGIDPVNTFTAGFSGEGEITEEGYARMVAARFRCRHYVHDQKPGNFLESIDTLVRHTEEPLVEPSGIPLMALAQLARPRSTVLLSGEGSDEVFGGYGLYRRMLTVERWHRRLPFAPPALPGFVRGLAGDNAVKYWDWLRQPLAERYRGTSAVLTDGLRDFLYTPDFRESAGGYLDDSFGRHFAKTATHQDPLSRIMYADTKTWLVDDLLLKADKMTMAASVELRVPFLDHRLVEMAASIPASLKIHGREGKWLLKRAFEDSLPREVVWRSKMGFPVPVKKWFGESLKPVLRERLLATGALPWLRREAVADLIENDRARTESRSRLIMTLVVLETWRRLFLRQ